MTELEKKMLISKDEYDYLMEHFGYETSLTKKPIVKQINYYFDDDELSMNRQNITCRIRFKEGKYIGTMKKHSCGSDKSVETEIEIYDGINKNAFTDMGLKPRGQLITERCVILKNTSCEVVLDKNDYLGYTDYELEIEYSLEHEKEAQIIIRVFRDMLVRRKCLLEHKEDFMDLYNVPSKSNRFFERKAINDNTLEKKEEALREKSFVHSKELLVYNLHQKPPYH